MDRTWAWGSTLFMILMAMCQRQNGGKAMATSLISQIQKQENGTPEIWNECRR